MTRRIRARESWYDSPWRIAARAVSLAVTIAVVLVAVAVFLIPRMLGGTSLTILTGSMEPTLAPGDVVVVRGIAADQVCSQVRIGQIVTYLPTPGDPSLITHRVIAKTIGTFDDGTSCRLITQGDANTAVDSPVSPAQVRGVFLYGVPKLGWARQWVGDHLPAVGVAGLALIVGYLIWSNTRPARTRVVAYPGGAGPGLGSAGLPSVSAPPGGFGSDTAQVAARSPAPMSEAEWELRLREVAVREREVAIREAELALFYDFPPQPAPGCETVLADARPAPLMPMESCS
jgi:signal peptidase